jgi:hypothetical protein
MFYNDSLALYTKTQGHLNDIGRWIEGKLSSEKSIEVDIQPYSKELAYRDHGYNEEVKFRVFCNPAQSLEVGSIVGYREKKYIVRKIIEWDTYWDVLIDEC